MTASIFKLLEDPGFREGDAWRRRNVLANETVFAEGEISRDVYLILKGRVRILGNVDLDG